MTITGGIGLIIGSATLIGIAPAPPAGPSHNQHFPLVELRQYTLHHGQRDVLIRLFEKEFIESQEALGMKVLGTFTDVQRPDRFVWLRGFTDMDARLSGLTAFYTGPVWMAHHDEANATMIDSDNVLLLRAPRPGAEFQPRALQPAIVNKARAGLIVASIHFLNTPPSRVVPAFEQQVQPALARAGVRPLAWFVTEGAPNNFPRLPVRNEQVLVWFARYADEADWKRHQGALAKAVAPLSSFDARPPEILRLMPTSTSELR